MITLTIVVTRLSIKTKFHRVTGTIIKIKKKNDNTNNNITNNSAIYPDKTKESTQHLFPSRNPSCHNNDITKEHIQRCDPF